MHSSEAVSNSRCCTTAHPSSPELFPSRQAGADRDSAPVKRGLPAPSPSPGRLRSAFCLCGFTLEPHVSGVTQSLLEWGCLACLSLFCMQFLHVVFNEEIRVGFSFHLALPGEGAAFQISLNPREHRSLQALPGVCSGCGCVRRECLCL